MPLISDTSCCSDSLTWIQCLIQWIMTSCRPELTFHMKLWAHCWSGFTLFWMDGQFQFELPSAWTTPFWHLVNVAFYRAQSSSHFSAFYRANLTKIISSLCAQVHQYADDIQLYLMQVIIVKVQAWVSSDWLRLIQGKTEFTWQGTIQTWAKIEREVIPSAFSICLLSEHIRVLLDEDLSMEAHVSSLCRSCLY